jgi:hypothetical protein
MSKRLLALAVVILAFAGPGVGQAFAATLIVDDDGMASPPANCGAPTPASSSIEAAVEAANPGDTVNVCPGTYPEQVSFEGDDNGITLRSLSFRAAVIEAPPLMLPTDRGDVVTVNGAQNVTLRDFTVAGPLPDQLFCSLFLRTGVSVIGGGSAVVRGNRITEMRAATPALRGCQNGFGLAIGRQFEGQTGRVIAFGNHIDQYQKGGIYVDNVGSTAVLEDNFVQGNGPDPQIAQNGMQISRGAVATVTDNVVQDNTYALAPASSATGVLLFQAGAQTTISQNLVVRNDDNIAAVTTSGTRILDNTILDSTHFDGIYMGPDTANNHIEGNFLRGNTEHDCHDDSGVPPTAIVFNTWIDNDGLTDNRGGSLCEIDDDDDDEDDDGDDDDGDDDDDDGDDDDDDDRGDED